MSNTKFVKSQMHLTMKRVTSILNISADIYAECLHEAGTNWLLEHFNNDTILVDDVMEREAFWNWWSLQAYHRDNEWLNSVAHATTGNYEPARLINDWLFFHSANRLCNMALKHAQILYNSYANINWLSNASHN